MKNETNLFEIDTLHSHKLLDATERENPDRGFLYLSARIGTRAYDYAISRYVLPLRHEVVTVSFPVNGRV